MSVTLFRVQAPGSDENIEERNDQKTVVSLPVVLGRGSLLKCGEKKVSRRHAYLDWEDDGVLLTSVHQNPTFIVVKGEEKQLTEGSSSLLTHGDMFGLMESSFWYKVCMQETVTSETEKSGGGSVSDSKMNPQAPSTEEGKEKGMKNEAELGKKSFPELEEEMLQSDKENKYTDNEKQEDTLNVKNNEQVFSTGEENRLQEICTTSQVNMKQDSKNTGALSKRQDPDSTVSIAAGSAAVPVFAIQEIQSSILERKRKLPSWMTSNMTKAEGEGGTSSSNTSLHPHGGGRKAHIPSFRKKKNDKTSDIDSQSVQSESSRKKEDRDNDSHEQNKRQKKMDSSNTNTPEKKGRKASPSKAQNQRKKNTGSSPLKQGNKKLHNISDEGSDGDIEDNESTTNHQVGTGGALKTSLVKPRAAQKNVKASPVKLPLSDSDEDVAPDDPGKLVGSVPNTTNTGQAASPPPRPPPVPTSTPAGTSRQSCQYGATCYRKNPQHRKQLAHPGDPDYHDAGSEDDDSNEDGEGKPECEYGVDCYRKNPQHRRQYKHTRFPQPQRKAKRKARQQKAQKATGGAGTSSEDDYDFDDPFLNDDSTDDYAPTDSSSDSYTEPSQEVDEDTSRMLKEGKKFVKRRRK